MKDAGSQPKGASRPSLPALLPPFAVAFATLLAFLPMLRSGFVDWDDAVRNADANFKGLGWAQIKWMFTTTFKGPYMPLTWLSYAVDYRLWGLNPAGYHRTDLLLHILNALFFYFIVVRLLNLAAPASPKESSCGPACGAFAALLFAAHPLRVESVAWIGARKDVLSGFFYLFSISCYLKAFADSGPTSKRWKALSMFGFLLSLLSKAITISLPATLILLDLYPLGRLSWNPKEWSGPAAKKIWLEKIPYLLLALAAGGLGLFGQAESGAASTLSQYGPTQRIAGALYGLAFYARKTLWPAGLSPMYEIPMPLNPAAAPFLLSGFAAAAVTGLFWANRRRFPAGLVAWLFYIATLAPVLGVVQFGSQLAADRYSYLSCLGWAALAGGLAASAWRSGRLSKRSLLSLLSAVLLLPILTWRQTKIWRDTETLWSRALEVEPRSYMAHLQLAVALVNQGRTEEAIVHYRQALSIYPGLVAAHKNLGAALLAKGSGAEAIEHFETALRLAPGQADVHYNLGLALYKEGKFDRAAFHYREAARIKPDYGDARNNLGAALYAQGKLEEALAQYREALRIEPNHLGARNNIGVILVKTGRWAEAAAEFKEVLRLNPGDPSARGNLEWLERHGGKGGILAAP